MERFTEWIGGHGAGKPGKDCYTQLAKYEDTELTPEQVFEMDRLYSEKCKELAESEKKNASILKEILREIEKLSCPAEGIGCGLEDNSITDRYEAAYFGWDEAIGMVCEIISNEC